MKAVLILASLLAVSTAGAANVLSVSRSVYASSPNAFCEPSPGNSFIIPGGGESFDSAGQAAFSHTATGVGQTSGYGQAVQNSSVSAGGVNISMFSTRLFEGTGCSGVPFEGDYTAGSRLHYLFEVDVPTAYSFMGDYYYDGAYDPQFNSPFYIELPDRPDITITDLPAGSGSLNYTGVLQPGIWHQFNVNSAHFNNSLGVYPITFRLENARFTLTPVVPESQTMMLLAALAAANGRRRKLT